MKCVKLALLCVVVIIISDYCYGHNITWGQMGWNDKRLHYEIIKKSSKFLQIVTKDVKFPHDGLKNNHTITVIRCTDQNTDGNGGNATLMAGGVSFNYTAIHFKSQRNHGFNFILEIFGR